MRRITIRHLFVLAVIAMSLGYIWIDTCTLRTDITVLANMSVESHVLVTKSSNDSASVRAYNNMDLYLRMAASKPSLVRLYESVLVQSMQYFWPDISSMVVVLDKEQNVDHQFGNTINKTFPFPRICYMDHLRRDKKGRHKNGMQRDLFYPEMCTSKKYVAFVDTDTMLITRIVPEMLFDGGKPIVIGVYGLFVCVCCFTSHVNSYGHCGTVSSLNHTFSWAGLSKRLTSNLCTYFGVYGNVLKDGVYKSVAKTTAKLFKTKEVMRCMSYFPVVMKVDHLVELRKYLETLHNRQLMSQCTRFPTI